MNRPSGAFGAVLACLLAVAACTTAAHPPSAIPPPTQPASATPRPSELPVGTPAPTSPTAAEIADLRERLSRDPDDPGTLRDLGFALLQRVRETGDPTLFAHAEEAFDRAGRIDGDDPLILVGIGGLQLARHDFAAALETAGAALAMRSSLRPAKAIEVDALVELGRYEEAVEATDELLALGVDLTSLARASYLREIHGNLEGALSAMEEAARAPALAPENTAYVTTIAGNLLVLNGRRDDAQVAYEEALALVPDHAPAMAGLGRLAVGDGDLDAAEIWFERASTILPLPEYVIALGETREASGDAAGAQDSYDLARLETQLFQANGVDVDLELALFEADHGDTDMAFGLAEQAYATRQTFRTADALAWASHRAGRSADAQRLAEEALRLGTRDPLLLYHAGMIASAAGDTSEAERLLKDALALDPGFSATGAAAARAELGRLDATP